MSHLFSQSVSLLGRDKQPSHFRDVKLSGNVFLVSCDVYGGHKKNLWNIVSKGLSWLRPVVSQDFERKTRLELATPTLARLCSTNWAISAIMLWTPQTMPAASSLYRFRWCKCTTKIWKSKFPCDFFCIFLNAGAGYGLIQESGGVCIRASRHNSGSG